MTGGGDGQSSWKVSSVTVPKFLDNLFGES